MWKGVPFYLRTGKRLKEAVDEARKACKKIYEIQKKALKEVQENTGGKKTGVGKGYSSCKLIVGYQDIWIPPSSPFLL